MLKIGILLGDDIGLEVVPEAVKVMKAAAAKTGLAIAWSDHAIGCNRNTFQRYRDFHRRWNLDCWFGSGGQRLYRQLRRHC